MDQRRRPQSGVVGWLNRKKFDETGDEEKSQGWTALVLDTNGNGKRDEDYVEPNEPVDPAKDRRIRRASTASASSRSTIRCGDRCWASRARRAREPGRQSAGDRAGRSLRAADAGLLAARHRRRSQRRLLGPLASGHLASFDRRKCKGPLNGPTATGQHCPEGWTLYPPRPQLQSVSETGSAEASYYTWVDQFDTLGLGENVPIAPATLTRRCSP